MLKKFKHWLWTTFLPAVAKETVYEENKKLREKIEKQDVELQILRSYTSGLEYGLRSVRRIAVNVGSRNEVEK